MAMDGDLIFPHSDTVMLPDFSQNHFEDFGKNFFTDSSLDTMNGANLIEASDFGFFKPLNFSGTSSKSSFGRDDAGRCLEFANTLPSAGSSSFGDAFFDVVNYQKQDIDLKQINMDPYAMTDKFSNLISPVKTNPTERSIKTSEALIAADALNSLSLEQLRQQRYSQEIGAPSSSHGISKGKSAERHTPLPFLSTQVSETVTIPSLPSNSSCFEAELPPASLSFIAEYPGLLSSSNFASMLHARAPSASTSIAPYNLDGTENIMIMNTSAPKAENQMDLPDELVQPCFSLMPSTELGGSSEATGVHALLSAGDDSTGDCLTGLPCQAPCSLPVRLMQRSFSSHSLGQMRRKHLYSKIDRIEYSPTQVSPSKNLSIGLCEFEDKTSKPCNMRRVYSTGDIQNLDRKKPVPCGSTSPWNTEMKNREAKAKIGCYTIEERKDRIHRYRQKRTERNFHKKIKYTCRKTLADSRPRVRGRFARNEDGTELQESNSNKNEDEEDDQVDATVEEATCAFNKDVPKAFRMRSMKIEHPCNDSFWNNSNARTHTSSFKLRGAHQTLHQNYQVNYMHPYDT